MTVDDADIADRIIAVVQHCLDETAENDLHRKRVERLSAEAENNPAFLILMNHILLSEVSNLKNRIQKLETALNTGDPPGKN